MKTFIQKFTKRKRLLLSVCFTLSYLFSSAQNLKQRTSDIMYQKTLTRALDLREKQNEGLFSRNREITLLLIEAVKANKISAYANDSLTTKLPIDQVINNLKKPSQGQSFNINNPSDTLDAFITYGEDWRSQILSEEEYQARDLYQLEIKEVVSFNKEKSRTIYDINAVTLYIPADHPSNIKGLQSIVASFSYEELKDKLFKDNPKAIWYNIQNDAQHKNLTDAFNLRLFSSYIVKVSNADDSYLADLYADQKTGIMASHWAANQLMEYEHHLWEY